MSNQRNDKPEPAKNPPLKADVDAKIEADRKKAEDERLKAEAEKKSESECKTTVARSTTEEKTVESKDAPAADPKGVEAGPRTYRDPHGDDRAIRIDGRQDEGKDDIVPVPEEAIEATESGDGRLTGLPGDNTLAPGHKSPEPDIRHDPRDGDS